VSADNDSVNLMLGTGVTRASQVILWLALSNAIAGRGSCQSCLTDDLRVLPLLFGSTSCRCVRLRATLGVALAWIMAYFSGHLGFPWWAFALVGVH